MLKERMIIFFKNCWLALILAIVFGLLMILPTLVSIQKIGWQNFQGVYPILSDDEEYYLSMAQDLREGHRYLGNPFYYEHKNDAEIISSLSSRLLAYESELFNLSIPSTFFINDFWLVFFGFLLLYLFLLSLFKGRGVALAGSSIYYLLFLPTFNRPVIPQFGIIFLFLGLNLIWKIYSSEVFKIRLFYSMILGLCIGLSIYMYPYYWTSLLVVYGLTIIWLIFSKLKAWYLSPLIFFVFISPFAFFYLLNMSTIAQSSYYAETTARLGLLSTHWPACYFNVGLLLITLMGLVAIWPRLPKKESVFAMILLISGVSLNWSNIFTGKYLQFSSHYYMVTILFVLISLLCIAVWLLKSIKEYINLRLWKNFNRFLISGLLIFFVIISIVIYKQKDVTINGIKLLAGVATDNMLHLQSYRPLFDWLKANTPSDSVVMVFDSELSNLLPVYTKNNLYSYGYGGAYLVSDKEMERRWLGQQLASGINNFDISLIEKNYRDLWVNGLIDNYQNKMMRNKVLALIGIKSKQPDLYDFRVQRVYNTWVELKNLTTKEVLNAYRLDYYIDYCENYGRYSSKLFKSDSLCVYKN